MTRWILEDAAALVSLSLFLAMLMSWAEIISTIQVW